MAPKWRASSHRNATGWVPKAWPGGCWGSARDGAEVDVWDYNGATNWNGGGLHFSNDYGYGLVDALAAVRLAETWTLQQTSANFSRVTGAVFNSTQAVPDAGGGVFSMSIPVLEAVDLERVALLLTALDPVTQTPVPWPAGRFAIMLTSPDGSVSHLLNSEGPAGQRAIP